jgi:hypothetical protein
VAGVVFGAFKFAIYGEVAEWLKAAFCKGRYTAKPYRRFKSFPSPPTRCGVPGFISDAVSEWLNMLDIAITSSESKFTVKLSNGHLKALARK